MAVRLPIKPEDKIDREDHQDAMIAAKRLMHVGGRITLEEIGRKYGLIRAS